MKFKIIGRRYDVTDKIRDYVEKKLGKSLISFSKMNLRQES